MVCQAAVHELWPNGTRTPRDVGTLQELIIVALSRFGSCPELQRSCCSNLEQLVWHLGVGLSWSWKNQGGCNPKYDYIKSSWRSQCNSLQAIDISYMMFIWWVIYNGVLWLIPARNFSSSPCVRATSPLGILAPALGMLLLTEGHLYLHTFAYKINGKHHQNP